MAIFDKLDKKPITDTGVTLVAKNTKIEGKIELECNLHVDGEIDGEIFSSSIITIGKTGFVEGSITAPKVIVNGEFSGTIDADSIEILSNGKVSGKISSKELVIERNGFFDGESHSKEKGKIQSIETRGRKNKSKNKELSLGTKTVSEK